MNDHRRTELPAELRRSTPRAVRLTGAGKAVAGVAAGLIAGAFTSGVWLGVSAEWKAARSALLESEGVSIEAEVAGLRRTRGDNPRRVVTYRYTTGGRTYRGQARLRPKDERPLEVGSTVPVRYLPSDRGVSWMRGYEPGRVPFWLVPVVPACLALAAVPIALHLSRQRRLLAEGRPVIARVRHSRKVQGKHNVHRVHFEFRIMSGAMRHAHFDKQEKPPPAGSTLAILYDREEPRRTARYPMSLVRLT